VVAVAARSEGFFYPFRVVFFKMLLLFFSGYKARAG
jgi:hypothetical protein